MDKMERRTAIEEFLPLLAHHKIFWSNLNGFRAGHEIKWRILRTEQLLEFLNKTQLHKPKEYLDIYPSNAVGYKILSKESYS
jgi:hypothetical protein